jgi:uncharacterized repeat protein (TIGR03843 family)
MDIVADRFLNELDGDLRLSRIQTASNAAFKIELDSGEEYIYKPISGERPLWDFEAGSLLNRELLSSIIFETMDIPVPRTRVLINGPYGIGLLQDWVAAEESDLFKIIPASMDLPGWLKSFRGYDQNDDEVALWHQANDSIRSIAFCDLILNNADRKGSHLLESFGKIYPIDHGLTFHHEPKLRTIFWGWAGWGFNSDELKMLNVIEQLAEGSWIAEFIADIEIEALIDRIIQLRVVGEFPEPPSGRAALPWPIA